MILLFPLVLPKIPSSVGVLFSAAVLYGSDTVVILLFPLVSTIALNERCSVSEVSILRVKDCCVCLYPLVLTILLSTPLVLRRSILAKRPFVSHKAFLPFLFLTLA